MSEENIIDNTVENVEDKEEGKVEDKIEEVEQLDETKPEEVKQLEQVEAKPKRKPRGKPPTKNPEGPLKLREKTNCPKCNKLMSVHALEYTHKCSATKLVLEDIKPKVENLKTEKPVKQTKILEPVLTQAPINKEDLVREYFKELKQKKIDERRNKVEKLFEGKLFCRNII